MNKVEYRVKRVTIAIRQCQSCGGVGSREYGYAGRKFRKPCTAAGCQNGNIKIEHETEISLVEALKEIGLIN